MDSETATLTGGYAPSHGHHAGAVQPLAQSVYKADKRTRTDLGWMVAWLVLLAFSFLGGIAILAQG